MADETYIDTLEALLGVVFVIDGSDNIQVATPAAREVLLATGGTIDDLIVEVTGDRTDQVRRRCETEGPFTNRKMSADSTVWQWHISTRGAGRLVLQATDVTDLAKLETEMELLVEKHRDFTELLPMIAFETDKYGVIESINESGLRLLGYEREDIVNKLTTTDFTPDHRKADVDRLFERRISGTVDPDEIELVTKAGEVITVLSYTIPKVVNGCTIGLHGIAIDITRRKKMEQDLKHAITQAEASATAKSRFLSRVSHELRTPLNAILGFSQLLTVDDSSGLNPKQADRISKIFENGSQLSRMIGEVIDIADLDAGDVPIRKESVSLNSIVSDVVEQLRVLAAKVDVCIDLVSPGEAIVIMGDERQISNLLTQVITNAVQASPPTKAVVVELESAGDGALVSVADEGVGIPVDERERVFDDFHRIEHGGDVHRGIGLGLGIARRLMEQHGGQISIEDREKSGSVVLLNFPRPSPSAEVV